MASKYAAYSKLRDIASKRAKRLSDSGLADLITFPTVKELKVIGVSAGAAIKNIESYLKSPTTVREYKRADEATRPQFYQTRTGVVVAKPSDIKKERRKAQNRESSRRYRERVRNLTKQEKSYMKAARTLGLRITPSQAQAFAEYMEFRFAQGGDSVYYKVARYVEDYMAVIAKNGHTKADILNDFNTFLSDRQELLDRSGDMTGVSAADIDSLFEDFLLE